MTDHNRALVIGANGFVGSHLVDELVTLGLSVTGFDRYSSAEPLHTHEATPFKGDFLNREDLRAALEGQDQLFHFLSTSTPATAENDPTFDIRTNVLQTVELMTLAVESGVKHVYFASTGGAIYGDSATDVHSELDETKPVSPYAIGKLAIENYLRYFNRRFGLATTSFRISNPFGPRQRGDRKQGLIPIALGHIARGEPVVQLGDGGMVRDYIFVEDLVKMIATVVQRGARHSVYNLGSGEGRSVSSVLATLREVTGRDFETQVLPKPSTFVGKTILDISRFIADFGAPTLTPFEVGVRATWLEMMDHQ